MLLYVDHTRQQSFTVTKQQLQDPLNKELLERMDSCDASVFSFTDPYNDGGRLQEVSITYNSATECLDLHPESEWIEVKDLDTAFLNT